MKGTYNTKVELYLGEFYRTANYTNEKNSVQKSFYGGSCLMYKNPSTGRWVECELLYDVEEAPTEICEYYSPNGRLSSERQTEVCTVKEVLVFSHYTVERCIYGKISNVVQGTATVLVDIPKGWVKLEDGKFMNPKDFFGKYKPNLLIINNIPDLTWETDNSSNYNLHGGSLTSIRGNFFKTKKGTNAFEVRKDGKHILIKDFWGGTFNDYRGGTLPEDKALYYRRASSNGGGVGDDYAIYPVDWINNPSLDDY